MSPNIVSGVRIVPVPCLQDNYAYLVVNEQTRGAIVVDPSEAEPVLEAAAREGVTLRAIACTHHHHDHVGGVAELLARLGALPVFAHESETQRIPETSRPLADGAAFEIDGVHIVANHVPGHTLGALAYVVEGRFVFTGDTMFVGGCGRLFEGTPAMMANSLARIAALPEATEVFPGHEYAEKNLRFARTVEPDNAVLAARLERVIAKRAAGSFCIPATIAEEKATNPFLRAHADGVKAFAASRGANPSDPVAVFAAVREARNQF